MPRPIDKPKRKPTDRKPRSNPDALERQNELLDEALEETFPASDPIAPARIRQVTPERPPKRKKHRSGRTI